MRIALDAMGGDQAPDATVHGAVMAAEAFPGTEIVLVGDEGRLGRALDAAALALPSSVVIHHASQVIGMHERPVEAVRKKPDSSLAVGVGLVAAGEAGGIVSAGNTGALVASTAFSLKRLAGVRRPGIAVRTPSVNGSCTVIDVGANVQCKPIHLYQYALMAVEYARHVAGCPDPRVGVLSIGEEDRKGNGLVQKVRVLLAAVSSINFIGNVEGGDLFNGRCDVAVCDGFVGNVMLKVSEGVAERIMRGMRESADRQLWTRLGLNLMAPVLNEVEHYVDFAEYGGAPLLGIDGICIIAHGRSNGVAIKNAIGAALQFASHDVNRHIVAALSAEA